MVLASVLTPEIADGIILAILLALVGILLRIWLFCASLWKLHDVRDTNGRPIWYGEGEAIKSLAEILRDHHKTTDKQCRVLDSMADRIEKMPACLVTELLRAGVISPTSGKFVGPSSSQAGKG